MTLVELIAANRSLFYHQAWYNGEAFTRTLPNESRWLAPTRVIGRGAVPSSSKGLHLAVDLAHAYVRDPMNTAWDGWLWARDVDQHGQRIFVGGLAQGHGFQIHRHLQITSDWGTPRWT